MRKSLMCVICSALIAVTIFNVANTIKIADASAQAEIAMELSTGKILVEGNADAKLPMASTTKILTAIIIVENCSLDEVITVPDKAVGVEGSSIYLQKDEQIDIQDLLYGLMLRSGNDSATALAIHHSGSVDAFAQVMNERAKAIGAVNSSFKNPSGLPDKEHYTTARDLCLIASYAMKNDTFRNIVSTTEYSGKFRSYSNKNKMLRMYEGANGVKTGYTVSAGRCLVSSAERNGMDVVCVVLNCPDMYERSCDIFNYCFNNYELLILDTNKVFMYDKILCKLIENRYFVVKKDNEIHYKVKSYKSENKTDEKAPVAELEIYDKNDLLFTEKLYSIIDE